MESKDQLRDLDRAAARPFIDYPRTPWWYPVLMGYYFSSIAVTIVLASNGNRVAAVAVLAAAIVALVAFVRWYRAQWGTWPQMTAAPAEIRRAYRTFFIGVVVALALTAVSGFLATGAVTVVVAFFVSAALFWAYERRVYPAACADVRARLA